jgi:glutathione S-transferase
MPQLTLYFAPGSSSMAPHIALNEIALCDSDFAFEANPISFDRGDNRTAAFLALNPEGKVPTLLIDGRPLTEVAGILYYLARSFPEVRLMPLGDIEAEAQIVAWMSFIAATLHPARRQGLEQVQKLYAIAEQRLSGRDWVVGAYSIADIHLFRLFWRVKYLLDPTISGYPNLMAHYARMMDRLAVKRTIAIEAGKGYEIPT